MDMSVSVFWGEGCSRAQERQAEDTGREAGVHKQGLSPANTSLALTVAASTSGWCMWGICFAVPTAPPPLQRSHVL